MPSINKEIIDLCLSKYNEHKFNVFVETGTWKGETILNMEKLFNETYTIEIEEKLYNNLITKYANNKINFIHGDSSNEIEKLCKNVLKSNTVFFLDGHWSKLDTGMGDKEVPLIEELTAINKYFGEAAIIIIDDVRLFGSGPNFSGNKYSDVDWSYINLENVYECIENRVVSHYYLPSECAKNDRLILNIRKHNLIEQNLSKN
tara:strand:+ start:1774 stop:2382 length:609 start_codon:yes stop_codon:yes gene_type:complete